jgi:hypothetical protein
VEDIGFGDETAGFSPIFGSIHRRCAAFKENCFPQLYCQARWGSPLEGKKVRKVAPADIQSLTGEVGKIGRTTGYTTGKISGTFFSRLPIEGTGGIYAFEDFFEMVCEDAPFSRPGDGGALVFSLESLRGLGILIAAS